MLISEFMMNDVLVRDHEEIVPLNWFDAKNSEKITIFARELVSTQSSDKNLPYLAFLQGGPGCKGPRQDKWGTWIAEALKHYRVVLLDQRGTGRSSRVTPEIISKFKTPSEGCSYLLNFRADSIVRDSEHFRKTTFGNTPWTTLGQSFGGFITLTYLSFAPEGLKECFVTGGLASINPSSETVYRHTYPLVVQKNIALFDRFPQLEKQVVKVAKHIEKNICLLPDGDRLTLRRLRTLGIDLGMSEGKERMLWLFEEAFKSENELSDAFLRRVMERTDYSENPLYVALQESIYGDPHSGATRWAASRVQRDFPQFNYNPHLGVCENIDSDSKFDRVFFTAEMMFPWMMDEVRSLKLFKEATNALHEFTEYSQLYDKNKLAQNTIPLTAMVYENDIFVSTELSVATAKAVNKCSILRTAEYDHNGLHLNSGDVLRRLMAKSKENN